MVMPRRGRAAQRNTPGRRMLNSLLKSKSQAALARELEIEQQSISQWKRGVSRPEPHYREALQRVALIPFEAWYSPAELAIARGTKIPCTSGEQHQSRT